ncbi:hypothetical protein LAUMK191_00945 [Mycobacterium attenuatum]|nr:hypothetical protein LAUMK191_00945 [Mycobacterium attenuatum]
MSRPDEVIRPRQVEPPLHIAAPGGPQAGISAVTDDDLRNLPVGEIRQREQALPATPTGRCRVPGAGDDVSDRGVQAVCADQQISFGRTAVAEFDPRAIVAGAATDHCDHAGVIADTFGRKAFQ